MKIIFLGTAHPYRGGIASFNEMLARQMISEGHQVEIITFTVQYPSFLFPGKTQYSDSPAPDNLDIERRLNSINPVSWILTAREIIKRRPDMLFTRYWTPYMAPALGTVCRLVKRAGIPVVALADNIIPHERHFYDNVLTRYFIGSVTRFVCMSSQVENELKSFGTDKPVSIAPHPVYSNYGEPVNREEACQRLGLDPECRYALFFGLVRDYKGLDILLNAWSELKKDKRNADKKLIVAGEFYTDPAPYIEQIGYLGLVDSVIIHDRFIPDDKVALYFSVADMVVQPYKSATQSGVTQIAYNFDLPMIVTPVGGLPEIVPDNEVGYVCTSDKLPEAIDKCFDTETNLKFREGVRRLKHRFSWEYMSSVVLQNKK